MPVGIQRLNAKSSQPNGHIIFIKPLKGPDEAIAQDFLERIAAQCLPVMREHHVSVMSLEEYEPNAEFVGRNFNAGEVVQLVLKARFTGRWLPFNYVQMVMMHELAHCKQMNHSKAFWAVRNQYADQMRTLWSRGYTGDGLWGRGALLSTGEFERNTVVPGEVLPEHLCGGTYQSRRRKRKAKKVLSYQEQKERRILKKFGANGVALGEDEARKLTLEGKWVAAKPRVAGSKRGRDLRAAAALARFEKDEKAKAAEEQHVKDEDDETASGSETESDYEEDVESETGTSDATDIDGKKLLDSKGHRMVKVCEDENPDDQDAQNELLELQSSIRNPKAERSSTRQGERTSYADSAPPTTTPEKASTEKFSTNDVSAKTSPPRKFPSEKKAVSQGSSASVNLTAVDDGPSTCPICSFANKSLRVTCEMCSHVLDPDVPNSWQCKSAVCQGSLFVNAADCGVCGVCGQRRRQDETRPN